MTHAEKITRLLSLYQQQLAYPKACTNLVLERSLYSFLYKHQSDLPAIDDNAHYKERFHMAFRDSEVTMDRVIDTIMFCLITRSTVIWDVLEYVAQEAGDRKSTRLNSSH